ncbi:HlyD family efflux transporter periplasmic adaptor subunit [Paenibacillus sp. P96]|uniref:HlyD family efflux transporter periplasmic adaptor subunit n=1 Tax=Paenibacillus zeirhizosphaerae TaxID=2987519 RepID=A0ABT9FLL2_9BACL|nr:HlyD family efflux transporter periplasmic adaptor subunit [Paenibacillus sp. P96]MDP4095618.1 HlyD family efflux transporter periplasmic adaptor subunit [Paenibacillus sp. P96]
MYPRAILVNLLVILVILAGVAAAAYYYYQAANYIETDNAQVSGRQISIAPSVAGKLVDWDAAVGKNYKAGDTLGKVASGSTQTNITMPAVGTIVQESAVNNAIVGAGTPIAKAYDLNNLWITANMEETLIRDLQVGQSVDVYIDAFPDTVLSGKVNRIGLATAGTFSLLPSSNTTANYTKVTQVIPVEITIQGYEGLGIVPGMSATIQVHK